MLSGVSAKPRIGGRSSAAPATGLRTCFTGFTPIATCHWQSIANVLAAQGFDDALRRLGLSWGIRWDGGELLFGGGRWLHLLDELFGVAVDRISAVDPAEAEASELAYLAERRPLVVEVDAFYLPSAYEGTEHVVHTVILLDRDDREAVVVDAMNNPTPARIPIDRYRAMREEPCAGRAEPHVLFAPAPGPYWERPPAEVDAAVRADVARRGPESIARLERFAAWASAGDSPINVCRVAAERYQAAILFDLLDEHGVAGACELAAELRALSDAWYMLHMLTIHERAAQERNRRRILRILDGLVDAERRAVSLCAA